MIKSVRLITPALAVYCAIFTATASAAGQCPLTEQGLLGGWTLASKAGSFEQMAFEIDEGKKRFNSWLHHRPEYIDSTWELRDCKIFVKHRDERLSVTLVVWRASPNRLYLREQGEKETMVYRRIKR